MSKIVSSVIGSAGAGDPSNPGSPASVREPYAWWKTVLPPCPITTTPPGSLWAATASFIRVEIGANSVVAACVPVRLTAYRAEAAATSISTAMPTAMAVRADALLAMIGAGFSWESWARAEPGSAQVSCLPGLTNNSAEPAGRRTAV